MAITPISDVKAFVFTTVVDGAALTPSLLAGDKKAANGRTDYDDAYYERFYREVRPVLEVRLAGSASGIASVLVAAWTEAGRPNLTPARHGISR